MSGLGLYIAFLVPPLVLGLAVQWWLKKAVARNQQQPVAAGMTGAQVARAILDRNGLDEVPVQRSAGGPLTDHYDPRSRSVHLSQDVYDGADVTGAAVAAHEVGHAIQHARAYAPMQIRSALFPVVAFASSFWMILLIGGAVLGFLGLVQLAIVLYAFAVVFHFVTLPVEFDASRRALVALQDQGVLAADEVPGARKVLNAAALTYVAGFVAALGQLIYFFALSRE